MKNKQFKIARNTKNKKLMVWCLECGKSIYTFEDEPCWESEIPRAEEDVINRLQIFHIC